MLGNLNRFLTILAAFIAAVRLSFDSLLGLEICLSLAGDAERTFLDHDTHDFVQGVCRGHGCVLSISVVRGLHGHDLISWDFLRESQFGHSQQLLQCQQQ